MISPKVMVELHQAKLVPTQFTVTKPGEHAWSSAEQRRFWEAIHRFPQGPWTAIAAYVGSKSTRQAMTHAQKLRQKLNRWKRRVRNNPGAAADATVDADDSVPSSPRSEPIDCDDDDDVDTVDGQHEHAVYALKDECETTRNIKSEHTEVKLQHHSSQHHHHQTPPLKMFDLSSLSPADVSGGDHDEYLDHLLSDIEPMLENVVNFTSPSRSAYAASAGMYHHHHHSNQAFASYPVVHARPLGDGVGAYTQFPRPSFELSASTHSASQPQSPPCYASSIDFRL